MYTEIIAKYAALKVHDKGGLEPSERIELRCWSTSGNDLYIGVQQRMSIHAPLAAVSTVLDDMDHYKELFPGFSDIHVIKREGNRSHSYWEQTIPIPLVANAKYEMIYQVESPSADQRLYRYQLHKKADLTASDGFILVSGKGENETLYTEVDFFDAHWGAAKVFGKAQIWTDALEGIALSDLAIKLKAEHKDWDNRRARKESKKILPASAAKDCFRKREPSPLK